ncbi:hypothetical protein EAL2_c15260 [Peptoclostridium acidaminophilum DSM 3953]|uniref:UspA domain-containing protein n=1 Tax=Peptoclostridium acidaminophilum DSM 3953 TaxID=1286171 RepID=W8U7G1_PEPAC|nr:hypothetical protein [Peptoclostridium acidaminophilum]AHM56821.1 hypothetical protein EAL2_c15260 [Peptoclostridium acidaminophilum DSM 3953]
MTKKVMVCVTKQKTSERLIKSGYKIAGPEGELYVLHITGKDLSLANCEVIQHLFDVSKKYDAQMSILHSKHVAETIKKFVSDNDINAIVLGESNEESVKSDMALKITSGMPDTVKTYIIPMSYSYLDKDVV